MTLLLAFAHVRVHSGYIPLLGMSVLTSRGSRLWRRRRRSLLRDYKVGVGLWWWRNGAGTVCAAWPHQPWLRRRELERRLVRVEEGLAGCVRGLCKWRREPVECAEAEHASEGTPTAPVAMWRDGEFAGNVIFVVIDVEPNWAVNVLEREYCQRCWLSRENRKQTSSTSSLRPDSPRTIPSGVPMM